MSTREMRCTACDGPMRAVDRRGVLIDICRDCMGVFLDRDELDKILDAAPSGHNSTGRPPAAREPSPAPTSRKTWYTTTATTAAPRTPSSTAHREGSIGVRLLGPVAAPDRMPPVYYRPSEQARRVWDGAGGEFRRA